MDLGFGNDESNVRCFKCDNSVICNLNIVYNTSNSTVTLWNKFQIYVYENLELKFASKVIIPEFLIHSLIISTNYLICVDCAGNIHTTSLKFKNAGAQKRFKGTFQPRESSVLVCSLFTEDQAICLKHQCNEYLFSIHKINAEFKIEKIVVIVCNEYLPLQDIRDKYILKSCTISDIHIERMKKIFKISDLQYRDNYNFILLTFDRLNVYCCLLSAKAIEEKVTLYKLYSCPSQISNMNLVDNGDLHILFGLQSGTLIILDVKEDTTKFVHLNTSIHNCLVYKDNIIYTDGLSMWKAENILSKDIEFSQLFVKDVKDFIKFGDEIICTTFSNLIYSFTLDDARCYIKDKLGNEYCTVSKLFQNKNYIDHVLDQVLVNNELIKKQKQERDYIMALSVSNRQDLMDKILSLKVVVYESYQDVIMTNSNIVLTNSISEYFDTDSFYFLIKINLIIEQGLGDILSNSIGDLRLHITLKSENKIVKTSTIYITDIFENRTLLIPLKTKFMISSEMSIDVKVIAKIPGAYDTKQKIWIVIYRKSVMLNSEHFIKFNWNQEKDVVCLKKSRLSLEELILERAKHNYRNVLNFINSEEVFESNIWHMYVRLPFGYQNVLRNEDATGKFTQRKVNYFLQQFTSEDFLQSKSSICFTICNEKVKIDTDNDGFTNPSLKISSRNVKIAFDVRNFLSNFIYCIFSDFGPGKEFISHSFYISVENLQRIISDAARRLVSEEEYQYLIEQFERKIIGALPI